MTNNNETNAAQLSGNWNYPTQIKFGVGTINQLAGTCTSLNIQKPLIVTDQTLTTLSWFTDILAHLQQHNITAKVFSDVKPNPCGENIENGVTVYNQGKHDGVIAIGGGSGLDAGKAIAFMCGQTESIWSYEDIGDNYLKADEQAIAPIIAIPTTSGTGSEVGRASVIVDTQTDSKKLIFHPKMLPSIVIADPQLTQGLPAPITAATGMDAFVHSLEAYCAPGFHPMADGIALQSMKLVKDNLQQATHQGSDLAARANMMVASTMGATAFQKGLGGVHALAHPLGAHYNAHHGLLNAILLPYVLKRNQAAIDTKITDIAHFLRISPATFDGFMDWLIDFEQQLNLPNNLGQIGIDTTKADLIGQQAYADPSASGNPIALTAQDYSDIFIQAVTGSS